MTNSNERACRQFERFFCKSYGDLMRRQTTREISAEPEGEVIATITYNPFEKQVNYNYDSQVERSQ